MSRFVRRLPVFVFALASLLTPLVPSGAAFALDRESCSMEILIDGTPLQEYAARGTSYVEAVKGREYSVRLRNRTGERVAIALSVDGLNSIDARTTTASEARKWILEPYGTITLDGWQTSSSTARRSSARSGACRSRSRAQNRARTRAPNHSGPRRAPRLRPRSGRRVSRASAIWPRPASAARS